MRASIVLLLAIAYQLSLCFRPVPFLLNHALVLDDAFYYVETARNFAKLGWITFDGIHATSGVQLLWEGILAILALIFPERMEFLRTMLVASVILNAIAGWLFYRTGTDLVSEKVGMVAVLMWSALMLRIHPTLMGMEYSLHVVIILCTILSFHRIVQSREQASTKSLVLLGILLTLNFWTRLDSAFYSFMIFIAVLFVSYRSKPSTANFFKRIAFMGIVLIFGAVIYTTLCLYIAGTPMPISGLVKSFTASQHFVHHGMQIAIVAHAFWYLFIQSRELLSLILPLEFFGSPWRISSFLLLCLVMGTFLAAAKSIYAKRGSEPKLFYAAAFLAFLYCIGLLHSGLIVITIGHFSRMTQHYYGWIAVTLILASALSAVHLVSQLQSLTTRRFVTIVILVGYMLSPALLLLNREFSSGQKNLNNRRFDSAGWINENLPPAVRLGAWNAGVLGYFSNRTIVNLDGLANDKNYLEFLKSGAPVEEYLSRENIQYLVDVDDQDMSMRFREKWNHSELFRNAVLWKDWQVIHKEPAETPIYVLQKKN